MWLHETRIYRLREVWLVQRSQTQLVNGGSRANKYLHVMQYFDKTPELKAYLQGLCWKLMYNCQYFMPSYRQTIKALLCLRLCKASAGLAVSVTVWLHKGQWVVELCSPVWAQGFECGLVKLSFCTGGDLQRHTTWCPLTPLCGYFRLLWKVCVWWEYIHTNTRSNTTW